MRDQADNAAHEDRLETLFERALALEGEARAAFLDAACRDDPGLRAELDSLLAHYERAPAFFDSLEQAVPTPQDYVPAALHDLSGRVVAHYRILERLGGGGMGVVYKAEDLRLHRPVALKFLPPLLSHDPQVRRRFEQEARAASALDHPNICTIHEIGEGDDGQLFLAMAYYAGQTLQERIGQGPLPLDEALGYIVQIARGLAKAHAAGIVHRDVKPANVMVTDEGVVKILDFGLAKVGDVQLTRTGTTLGTTAYMSPEQAHGEAVDAQTDVWSLGVVLYEMLTGERPFKGTYPQAVIYSILHEEPTPVETVNPAVPEDVAAVVGLCLEKDRGLRYPSMADLLADLDVFEAAPPPPPARRPARPVVVTGLSVVATLLVLLAVAPVREAVLNALGLAGLPAEKHLVVLAAPGEDGETDATAFTDGVVETLTDALHQLEKAQPSLWVVPAADVRSLSPRTAEDAHRLFDVNLAVLVGVVQQVDTVRVALDLVDAATARSLERTEIVRPRTALSALHNDLTAALPALLRLDLPPPDRQALSAGGTSAPGAYQYYTQGLGYLQRFGEANSLEAAITLFQRALDEDPDFALAHAALGRAYWHMYPETRETHWIEKAEASCQRALERDDRLTSAYVTLGLIDRTRGKYGTAAAAFQMALEHDPANTDAYRELAKTYEAVGRIDDAEAAYRKAISLKPDYWLGYAVLGSFFYNQARYEDAVVQFQHVIDLAPLNVSGYRNLASMYWLLGRTDDAVRLFEEAKRVDPDDYLVYHNLSTLYFYEGNYKEAARAYEQVTRLQEGDFLTWGNLAESYYWTPDERARARAAYERAARMAREQLALNPRDADVLTHLAAYYARLDSVDQARMLLDRLAAMKPLDAKNMFRIGSVYEDLGERDSALAWIERSLGSGYAATQINSYPGLKNLRADERFQDIIAVTKGDARE